MDLCEVFIRVCLEVCVPTGHSSDTRRLVVAISLSGSAVNFSLTMENEQTDSVTFRLEPNTLSTKFQTSSMLLKT